MGRGESQSKGKVSLHLENRTRMQSRELGNACLFRQKFACREAHRVFHHPRFESLSSSAACTPVRRAKRYYFSPEGLEP